MLYPLGWLPPEVPHSPESHPVDEPLPALSQAHPRQTASAQVVRSNLTAPEGQFVAARRPTLSASSKLVAVGPEASTAAPPESNGPHAQVTQLQLGARGQAVTALQTRLQTLGYYPGPLDGIYGPITEAAVRAFQRDHSIQVDGIVGLQTWNSLKTQADASPRADTSPPAAGPLATPFADEVSFITPSVIASPDGAGTVDGPVFTPALIPDVSFHPLEVVPVAGSSRLVWVTILTVAASGAVAFYFKPDSRAIQSRRSSAQSRTLAHAKNGTIHRPEPVYPATRRAGKSKPRVIHRPQPIYPAGYQQVSEHPECAEVDASSPLAEPSTAAKQHSIGMAPSSELLRLSQQCPWAGQAAQDYLTSFLYDLQEADSRQRLEGVVATPKTELPSKAAQPQSPSLTPLRRLGTFPDRSKRTGNAYTYMLVDDMGGCFRLLSNELWLTEAAMQWLNNDEPYTLTVRRINTSGRTVDKAFTVKLNTYQMQMAS